MTCDSRCPAVNGIANGAASLWQTAAVQRTASALSRANTGWADGEEGTGHGGLDTCSDSQSLAAWPRCFSNATRRALGRRITRRGHVSRASPRKRRPPSTCLSTPGLLFYRTPPPTLSALYSKIQLYLPASPPSPPHLSTHHHAALTLRSRREASAALNHRSILGHASTP